jgi:predicted HNH restriction endonuclease
VTVSQLSRKRLSKLRAAIRQADRQLLRTAVRDVDSLTAEERWEGGKKRRFTNYYERKPKLRLAAIRCHGMKCNICGFDFEETYGDRGKQYIEVHHLRPVSSLAKRTRVDPKTDMTTVCSNCHRMIHRRTDDVLSLKSMRTLLETRK